MSSVKVSRGPDAIISRDRWGSFTRWKFRAYTEITVKNHSQNHRHLDN